jgi:hypothetical protein
MHQSKPQFLIRFLFATYIVLSYVLSAIFAGLYSGSNLENAFATTGLVFLIMAIGGLMIIHKQNSRPINELFIIIFLHALVYFLTFQTFDFLEKHLWSFMGAFNFITICGGFLFGIFLAPLIYAHSHNSISTKPKAMEIVKEGINYIKKMRLIWFGIVLIGGTIVALVYFFNKIMISLEDLTQAKKITLYIIMITTTFIITRIVYSNTVFGITKKDID